MANWGGSESDWGYLVRSVDEFLERLARTEAVDAQQLRARYASAITMLRVCPPAAAAAAPDCTPPDLLLAVSPPSRRNAVVAPPAVSPIATPLDSTVPDDGYHYQPAVSRIIDSSVAGARKYSCDLEAALAGDLSDGDDVDGPTSDGARAAAVGKGSAAFVSASPVAEPPLAAFDRPADLTEGSFVGVRLTVLPSSDRSELWFTKADAVKPDYSYLDKQLTAGAPLAKDAIKAATPCMVETKRFSEEVPTWARGVIEEVGADGAVVRLVDSGRLVARRLERSALRRMPAVAGRQAPLAYRGRLTGERLDERLAARRIVLRVGGVCTVRVAARGSDAHCFGVTWLLDDVFDGEPADEPPSFSRHFEAGGRRARARRPSARAGRGYSSVPSFHVETESWDE